MVKKDTNSLALIIVIVSIAIIAFFFFITKQSTTGEVIKGIASSSPTPSPTPSLIAQTGCTSGQTAAGCTCNANGARASCEVSPFQLWDNFWLKKAVCSDESGTTECADYIPQGGTLVNMGCKCLSIF